MAVLKGFEVTLSINGEASPDFEVVGQEPTPSTPSCRRSSRLKAARIQSDSETSSAPELPLEALESRYNLRASLKKTNSRLEIPQSELTKSVRVSAADPSNQEEDDVPKDRKCVCLVEAVPGVNFTIDYMYLAELNGGRRFSYPGIVAAFTVDGKGIGCQPSSKPISGHFSGRPVFIGVDYYEEAFRFSKIKYNETQVLDKEEVELAGQRFSALGTVQVDIYRARECRKSKDADSEWLEHGTDFVWHDPSKIVCPKQIARDMLSACHTTYDETVTPIHYTTHTVELLDRKAPYLRFVFQCVSKETLQKLCLLPPTPPPTPKSPPIGTPDTLVRDPLGDHNTEEASTLEHVKQEQGGPRGVKREREDDEETPGLAAEEDNNSDPGSDVVFIPESVFRDSKRSRRVLIDLTDED